MKYCMKRAVTNRLTIYQKRPIMYEESRDKRDLQCIKRDSLCLQKWVLLLSCYMIHIFKRTVWILWLVVRTWTWCLLWKRATVLSMVARHAAWQLRRPYLPLAPLLSSSTARGWRKWLTLLSGYVCSKYVHERVVWKKYTSADTDHDIEIACPSWCTLHAHRRVFKYICIKE